MENDLGWALEVKIQTFIPHPTDISYWIYTFLYVGFNARFIYKIKSLD